ncbi:hypothetical protein WICPIJ_001124 [Wickerhamomyces pijperi]|uniref:OPA3-like protein n=1 Tax=Wickerhamomyces pijperi TaxID=599730 RepID=A0A9P8QC80_WICPI|nr:hypothetical protein WICPIJ_001124 [Wickerhamomyces pijperi]
MSGIGIKLGSLLLRQVSKPIANILKAQAIDHEVFKKVCIWIAQRLHRTDVTLRMKLMGEKGAKVRPLNDKKAVENGANFLSETFIFSVAGSIVLFESWRQRQKELTRRETVADDIKTLQYEIDYLKKKLTDYNVRLDDYSPPKDVMPLYLKLDNEANILGLPEELKKADLNISEAKVAELPKDQTKMTEEVERREKIIKEQIAKK